MRSQVLGLFGDIVNGIGNIFSGIANWFSDRIGQYIDYLVSIILKFAYEILKVFFILIDFVQLLFRKIAGLDTVRYNGQENISGDIAWWLFQQPAVTDALISLIVVAVVMVFMATFVAIIRNNYKAKEAKETAIGPVIGQAFKALFSFIFVPIVCYFGVFVSNGLLKTIDQATRISDSVSISGEVFAASAMSSNRARTNSDFAATLQTTQGLNFGIFLDDNTGVLTGKTAADKIDRAFATQQKIEAQELTISDSMAGCEFMFHQPSPGEISQFDYRNTNLVFVYYDLTQFNWLFAFVSCFFITTTLLYAAMGVIQRLFEITLLFAVSPPFIALMPLDGGSAFKNWAQKFIQSTVIMYGTVVALNFFFIVAPLMQQIDLFYSADEIAAYGKLTCDLFNGFAHILFIMCGSLMIKDFTGILTELTAGKAKDLRSMGEEVYGDAKGNAGKMASKASAAHKFANKVGSKAKKAAGNYFDPANVAARRQARQDNRDRRAAEKAAVQGMRQSGELSYMQGRRLLAEQHAADRGKQTLRSRISNRWYGKNDKLEAMQQQLGAERDKIIDSGDYATERNDRSQRGLRNTLAAIKNGEALTARGAVNRTKTKEIAEKRETDALKKYRAQREEYENVSKSERKNEKQDAKGHKKAWKTHYDYNRSKGDGRIKSFKKARKFYETDAGYYDENGEVYFGTHKGHLKQAERDLKAAGKDNLGFTREKKDKKDEE